MVKADMILLSDAIFDSVKHEPFPGGVVIGGDKILFVGPKDKAMAYADEHTDVRDYGDRLISPGFCDGHCHVDGTAEKIYPDIVKNITECTSEEEVIDRVLEYYETHKNNERILGINFCSHNWNGAPNPTKKSLDARIPQIPVYLRSVCGHYTWMNTAAMEECHYADIVASIPDCPNEWAERDENGEFTGLCSEMVSGIVQDFAQKYTQEEREGFQEQYLKWLPSQGVTAVTDVTIMPWQEVPKWYHRYKVLENKGELPVRAYIWAGNGPGDDPTDISDAEQIKILSDYFNTDRLRIAGLKSIIDGVPDTFTAAFVEPYYNKPDTHGAFMKDPSFYLEWTPRVNAIGLAVKYHCVGDAAVRVALDAFEKSNSVNDNTGLRNSIEHMESIDLEDRMRFKPAGVIASMQPAHQILEKGGHKLFEGPERAMRCFNYRSMLDCGAILSIGTDAPVVEINPYRSVYKAVTRLDLDGSNYDPELMDQAPELWEVLRGYTWGSAYASNMEDKVGTLEAGKYADIVVSDRNLFAVDPMELKDAGPILTISGGKITYEA